MITGVSLAVIVMAVLGYVSGLSRSLSGWIARITIASVTVYGEAYSAVCWRLATEVGDTDVVYGDCSTGISAPSVTASEGEARYQEPRRPAPGVRAIRLSGRRAFLEFGREKFQAGYVESLTIRMPRRSARWLCTFVEECILEYRNDLSQGLPVYYSQNGWWAKACTRPFRRVETIEHPECAPDAIVRCCRDWLQREGEFVQRGENYQLGFLLYGAPGTGKTSMAIALASELRRPLYVLIPNREVVGSLGDLLRSVPGNAVLLVEECEQLFPLRDGSDVGVDRQTAAALSYFDGPLSKHGLIRVYVTNHPESLDGSFRRPGRCDYEYEFVRTRRSTPTGYIDETARCLT